MNVYSGEKLGTVVTGSICGGQLYVGGHVNVHCMGRKVSESAIDATEMFHKLLDHAEKGDVVGLSLLGLPANGVSVGCTVVTLGKMVSSMFIEGEFTLTERSTVVTRRISSAQIEVNASADIYKNRTQIVSNVIIVAIEYDGQVHDTAPWGKAAGLLIREKNQEHGSLIGNILIAERYESNL